VAQFAVAALYERRNLLNLKPAVIDRRYNKQKCASTESVRASQEKSVKSNIIIKLRAETACDITLQAAHAGREWSLFARGGRDAQVTLFVICASKSKGNEPGNSVAKFLAQVPELGDDKQR
jgi:hypothetical protein